MCQLMVVCNIAWWACKNPYWLYFFNKWVPGGIMAGQKQMSGCILDEQASIVEDVMKSCVKGKYGTGQCNGWKNIAKTSLIALMVNIEYTLHLLRVANISSKPKTAQILLDIVSEEVKYYIEV
ncbi:hypothetical protein B0H34DRAFT_850816 [Crassisporium funariophilum]|nr:hypothetical protein B0H34DRAFT_838162 [Crassisporium funariophilum]KAF8155839.1 hypothetical protein B0H34DRAFT_850816 [Crassisporium funariophilum]